MTEFTLSYREVIPYESPTDNWNDITLTTGGTQSTLQDIKVPERANGFCYDDSSKHHMRNRFIYWRINYDVLELVEHSLDINLTGNRVRYKFSDTPILDGVSIHETYENVVVLVPTVCSVHRLLFPHPDRFHRQDEILGTHPDLAAPSIFSKATALDAKIPSRFHVFSNPSTAGDQLPNLACSYLLPDTEDAYFILSYPSTELLLLKLSADSSPVVANELKGESLMPRFLSGLAEKFRQRNSDGDHIVSLLFYILDNELYVLTLSRDGHLKFWSCSKGQCVAVIDILAETGNVIRDRMQTATLRKAVDQNGLEGLLAVYLSFPSGCQFHVLNPTLNGQQIKINQIHTFPGPENDLIDFAIQTNRLWSAWRCENGECAVYIVSLRPGGGIWTPVHLESAPDADNIQRTEGDADPRQIYLQNIFYPFRFPLNIIGKALSIYRRSTAILGDTHLINAAVLRQRICMAVENEIQDHLGDVFVNDDEYLEAADWCWERFYSCCVEYHVASLKPLGIMLLPSVSGAVFLKKSTFSFLRPLDPLEHMTLSIDYADKDQFINFALFSEDSDTIEDILSLFKVIIYLEQQFSDSFAQAFERELLALQSPDIVMDQLLQKIECEMDTQFCRHVMEMLSNISDLYKAIHKVLELLRYESTLANPDNEINPSAMLHFSSKLGISVVASCLRQQAQIRFQICRNLLLICNILMTDVRMEETVSEAIRSVCTPEIVVLTQASFAMLWLSRLPALTNIIHETSQQRLITSLKLQPVYNFNSTLNSCTSLLELFTSSTGGHEARKSFARVTCSEQALAHWHLSLLPLLNHLRHIIWPISGGTVLEEWLLASGQYLWLQQYVRLLSSWCEWNSCTRDFFLAVSFLTSGENYKAYDLFVETAKGVFTDPFLQQRILKDDSDDQNKAYANYYLKVIQLFELHKARDFAISVADIALGIVEREDPCAAIFYSIKFKHHLALKHYEQAFHSLNDNPDTERKKDNLRDLVKHLLDEKKLDVLLNFTYGGMEGFFTDIILTRARATEGIENFYYDFLFSYQVNRGPLCFRLAASAMYEQAFRLNHLNTVEALEKQVKCYLAAKNVLQLCRPEHAWVVRPADPDVEDEEIVLEPLAGSNEPLKNLKIKKQVEVVSIEMMKTELAFASARLKLARFDPKASTNITTPIELITLLNSSGLYKNALQICTKFGISYSNVFESLTRQCVILSEQESPDAWNWLIENDLQDLPVNRDNISDVVWKLLEDYLNKYEEPGMTTLHYVVCKKIISLNIYIPFWLMNSYKLRNSSELLRLLHSSGRLEEAIEVVHGLLLAAMGYGKENYGFQHPMAPSVPPFCLPVYGIQLLVEELEVQNAKSLEKPYVKEHIELKGLLQKYLETSTRISNQRCQTISTMGTIKKGMMILG